MPTKENEDSEEYLDQLLNSVNQPSSEDLEDAGEEKAYDGNIMHEMDDMSALLNMLDEVKSQTIPDVISEPEPDNVETEDSDIGLLDIASDSEEDNGMDEDMELNLQSDPPKIEKKKKEKKVKEKKIKEKKIKEDKSGIFSKKKKPEVVSEEGIIEDPAAFDLLDENENLMQQLSMDDDIELEAQESGKEGKKGKKEKKPKKEKTPKPPKEKKPKKVKEKKPEEMIKIPAVAVIFIVTFVCGLTITLLLCSDAFTYNQKIKRATDYYIQKDYSKAYTLLSGLEMKKEDKDFYKQVRTVMYVEKEYESYQNFIKLDMRSAALDSLLKGVDRFDRYSDKAKDLGAYDDLQGVYNTIITKLSEDFSMSESQAHEVLALEDRLEYSSEVNQLAGTE